MFLSYQGEEKEWHMRLTFNSISLLQIPHSKVFDHTDILTIVAEIWGFVQLLYFGISNNETEHILRLDSFFSFTVFFFPSLPIFYTFAASTLLTLTFSFSFFTGWAIHNLIPVLYKYRNGKFTQILVEMEDLHEKSIELPKAVKWWNAREHNWNQFKQYLLKV